MVVASLCMSFSNGRASGSGAQTQPICAAYLLDSASLTLRDEDAKYLTHLYYSFGQIADGRLYVDHLENWDTVKAYRARHPHIRLLLAIGGWGADGFSQVSRTAAGRTRFVESVVDVVRAHGLDGIDLDWEYPTIATAGIEASPNDRENLVLLVRELRAALDALGMKTGKSYHLSLAVGASSETAKGIDARALNDLLDCVNIMTYDLRGEKKATHHANLYAAGYDASGVSADAAVRLMEQMGFSRDKLVIGGAAYGRIWTGARKLGGAATNSGNKAVSYDTVRTYIASGNYTYHWDETAQAPYLIGPDRFVSFDDPSSMRLKGAYARENGLAGMMYWEYTQDSSGALLQAMSEGLRTD